MQTDMTYKKKGLMENIVTDQRPGRQQKKKINRYTCRLKSANVEQVLLFVLSVQWAQNANISSDYLKTKKTNVTQQTN